MASYLLMLEDNGDRLRRFAAVLSYALPDVTFVHWRNAQRMIRECMPYLSSCAMICLDHDLDPEAGEEDPGDGLIVARFLAPLKPGCPILIHSSNGDGARRMVGEFELEGLDAQTILPLGADWIERYWLEKVKRALVA